MIEFYKNKIPFLNLNLDIIIKDFDRLKKKQFFEKRNC